MATKKHVAVAQSESFFMLISPKQLTAFGFAMEMVKRAKRNHFLTPYQRRARSEGCTITGSALGPYRCFTPAPPPHPSTWLSAGRSTAQNKSMLTDIGPPRSEIPAASVRIRTAPASL
jgi:hypothetical protein